MSNNKKYYYLKLKENFYDSEELIILQNMQDGYLYSDILMKLYLRSLKNNGKLMFKDVIPYTPTALAQVVRHQVGTVEKALKIFQELGLIEVLDNGAIYMSDIQNFIGKSSTEADRKRQYRDRIDGEMKLIGQMSDKCPDKNPPEIEKEIEIEIEKDIEIDNTLSEVKTSSSDVAKASKRKYGEYKHVLLKDEELQALKRDYSNWEDLIKYLDEYIEMKGYKAKSHYLCIKRWVVDAVKERKKKHGSNDSWEEFIKEMKERGET